MTRDELARLLDHSVLKPESTAAEVRAGADVVRTWRIGCYCVQPSRVRLAAGALAGADALVASVVGFPHGCDRADVKANAAALAVADGAREIDMVMNFGALLGGEAAVVAADIEAVVRAVPGVPVKVILEASALGDDEKRLACRLCVDAGAAYVKTSTGFHPSGGATVGDVRLMRAAVGSALGVKASGGIRTLADAIAMIEAGASRIGTSASAAMLAALR
ncbi:deoxyribose-phosphate aldolase [Burkholderiales bacterium]|nr:deoxyribose-phosphate aldolase [Burkholderiales bacterium]